MRTTDVVIDLCGPRVEVPRPRGRGLPLFDARGRGGIDLRSEILILEQPAAEGRAVYQKLRGRGHMRRQGRRE